MRNHTPGTLSLLRLAGMKTIIPTMAVLLGLSLQHSITRRLDMTYDGKQTVIEEGQDLELPCKHADGKTHRLKVARAKTYEFKGLGVRLDFESSMNVSVENLGAVTQARFIHDSGSYAGIQQFHAPPGDAVLTRMDAGIRSQLEPMGSKLEASKPSELDVGGETLKGFAFTGKLGAAPVHLGCYWRAAPGGGHMFQFYTVGRPAGPGEAFGLIAQSMKFEPLAK